MGLDRYRSGLSGGTFSARRCSAHHALDTRISMSERHDAERADGKRAALAARHLLHRGSGRGVRMSVIQAELVDKACVESHKPARTEAVEFANGNECSLSAGSDRSGRRERALRHHWAPGPGSATRRMSSGNAS